MEQQNVKNNFFYCSNRLWFLIIFIEYNKIGKRFFSSRMDKTIWHDKNEKYSKKKSVSSETEKM